MAFKCLDCGHIFEEGEQVVWEEKYNLDTPPYNKMSGCPICYGAYKETVKCVICGAEHLSEELNGGVCDECIDEVRKDFDMCYRISMMETTEIKINSLLAMLFDESDIEAILRNHIKEKCKDVDCSQFIDEGKSWFGERLAEEVKKNECKKK